VYYNPPGIRGEPRYLEGVIKLTKLHGSLDWYFNEIDHILRRYGILFGVQKSFIDYIEKSLKKGENQDNNSAHIYQNIMIYPNPAKDIETLEYPYAELFRDFSAALCRPNSVLITY